MRFSFLSDLKILSILALSFSLTASSHAQPTWGRPKETHPPGSDNTPRPHERPTQPQPVQGQGVVSDPGHWSDSDPELKQPTFDCEAGEWYAATTKAGCRFAWATPVEFEKGKAYDVVVLLHPTGANVRWGMETHTTANPDTEERFRPDNILICADGLTSIGRTDERRAFITGPQTIEAFRAEMLEFTQQFPVRRIYLFGYESGADFALAFSARYPALVDGLILHNAGPVEEESVFKANTPLIFIQGAKHSKLPVDCALHNCELFAENQHSGVRCRILPALNEFPSPLKVSECIDWATGMQTTDAAEVLARAEAILTPKGPDEFNYTGPVWYTGAYELLQRITHPVPLADPNTKNPPILGGKPLDQISDETLAGATALIRQIDAHAQKQIDAIKQLINEKGVGSSIQSISNVGSPAAAWLWQVRQDFRGIPCVEEFVKSINYDTLLAEHDAVARDLSERWTETSDPIELCTIAAEMARTACLSPSLPLDLGSSVRSLTKDSAADVPEDLRESFELILNVEKAWIDGARAYAKLWRTWSLPE